MMIESDGDRYFQVGAQLPLVEKEEFIGFLNDNVDVFVWSAYEAPGINPDFICHHLNVNPGDVPKSQPPRHSSKEHAEAVKEDVIKLKQAGAIKELYVDFMDLNKACPMDHFPLPQIDQLVDATVGHPQMSFLDAF